MCVIIPNREGRVLRIIDQTGLLHPKAVPFSVKRYRVGISIVDVWKSVRKTVIDIF